MIDMKSRRFNLDNWKSVFPSIESGVRKEANENG